MKFKTAETFETEAIIEVAQRLAAVLQDAGVVRVENLNVYLNIVDKSGARRTLQLGGELVETFALDCSDLTCAAPAATLELARPSSAIDQRRAPSKRRRS